MSKRFEDGKRDFQSCVQNDPPESLYKRKELNYRGDQGRHMDEIAGILVGPYSTLEKIRPRPRPVGMSYNQEHTGKSDSKNPKQFSEKQVARALYNHSQKQNDTLLDPKGCLGKIIDYEVPLKSQKAKSDPLGKIDLLSLDPRGQTVRLVELKIRHKEQSGDETLLRAVTEIFTYFKLLGEEGRERIFSDYKLSQRPPQLVVLSEAQSLSAIQMGQLADFLNLLRLIRMMAGDVGRPIILASFELKQTEIPRPEDTIKPEEANKPHFDPRFLPITIREIRTIGANG